MDLKNTERQTSALKYRWTDKSIKTNYLMSYISNITDLKNNNNWTVRTEFEIDLQFVRMDEQMKTIKVGLRLSFQ